MKLHKKTLTDLAEMICGASGGVGFERKNFPYRSSYYLSEFFAECGLNYSHNGSTRKWWVLEVLEELNSGPSSSAHLPPDDILRVIHGLMDPVNFEAEDLSFEDAVTDLNRSLKRDGLEAHPDEDGRYHIRSTGSGVSSLGFLARKSGWTAEERERRKSLEEYLDSASEDGFTEEILLPLFQRLGFIRVSHAGHKDKALEYGKDIWMKYQLPTDHFIYFGVQVKRDKLVAAARRSTSNISEVLNQIQMALQHPIWDPEDNRKHLLDHVFIISAGEITKQARNLLGEHLDREARRHILFLDRADLLNLAISSNLPLPQQEMGSTGSLGWGDDDDIPF